MEPNRGREDSLSESGPITYTPTTRRVSKAKKGKRVHACEFPGCNKVFTRAEHRRRHELNHNPEAPFRCHIEGCGKGFHRPDLLARHMEKHNIDPSTATYNPGHDQDEASQSPMGSEGPSLTSVPSDRPAISQQHSPMAMSPTSQPAAVQQLPNEYSMPPWEEQHRTIGRGGLLPNMAQRSMLYSSRDSSHSPSFESRNQLMYPLPASPMNEYASAFSNQTVGATARPVAIPIQNWDEMAQMAQSSPTLGTQFGGDILQPVASSAPIPLSSLDGEEWFTLRRELTSAPGVISGDDGMEIIDTMKWQDCFECYWRHFHPLFPIVHPPSFFATKPTPLLSGAMVAIGSQYDTRQNAKEYSLVLLEACLKLLSKRAPITSRSRVSDIQAVFLLEILSKYRSRRADVQLSYRFKSLYGSFLQDRHWVSRSPTGVLATLSGEPNQESLQNAQKFWIEHEVRRRVLQAAFILDIQHSVLFQQPLIFLQSSQPTSNPTNVSQERPDLPYPCDSDLWESKTMDEWFENAKKYRQMTLSVAAERMVHIAEQKFGSVELDPFQSSLVIAHYLLAGMPSGDLEKSLGPLIEGMKSGILVQKYNACPHQPDPEIESSHSIFAYHALLAAYRTPIHSLLTVSGESWLFNRKVPTEAEFQMAKQKLRAWVSDTPEVQKAVWHAVRALEYAINAPSRQETEEGPSPVKPGPLTMLTANWSLYICTLICWAYGIDIPASSTNVFAPAVSARFYVQSLISLAPSWTQISKGSLPTQLRRDTGSLLGYIRVSRLQGGVMGGLLNEGERVLERLMECQMGTSTAPRTWEF